MPHGDRTGPAVAGPRTGRTAGFCAGYDQPGFMHPAPGRGYGAGTGMGYGGRQSAGGGWGRRNMYQKTGVPCRHRFPAERTEIPHASAAVAEKEHLVGQAEILQRQIEAIHARIDELTNRN